MAYLKSIDRSAFVAMSPDSPFMATGTMAGAIDLSFSSSANLEIFHLDFNSNDQDLKPVGQCPSPERFNRLAWGSYGLIAGGLVDGNIGLWNPIYLISSEANENAHVKNLSKHKGPVRALEFNVIVPNQLASGSDDGTVCIWDVTNPSQPCHFLMGTGSVMQSEISSVSWNREFQHVLASTSYNGTTVLWDVNNEKVITEFRGPVRCSALQWDPDNTNQIIVASDEDCSPTTKLLDIRYPQSPVRTFVGHQRGIITMEWCPSDSLYLLTCGKDNRTICWNTKTAEIVTELPTGNNWNFDVHWYPKLPGIISTSSVDGKIGIYNLEGGSRYGIEENNLVSVPKWWKRPVGASFGFGGKLVSFNSKLPEASEVFLHSLATEQSLVNRISNFEAAIENGEKTSLRGFCEKKSEETESEEEKETWSLLKIMLEEDGTSKTKLRTQLGFSIPSEEKGQAAANDPHATKSSVNVEEIQQMPVGEEESSNLVFDDAILRSLIVGDYNEAVAQCLSENKMADALVIAHVGGTSLWESTRDKYLKSSNAPYMKVVSAMLNDDLMSLVQTRPPSTWKETLALICTFAEGDEWTNLCDALATNLMDAGFTLAATFCYICADNVDKTVDIWSRSLGIERDGKSYAERVQDLMEKTLVLSLAPGNKRFSATLSKLFESYAEILASQGLLATAMKLLKVLDSVDLSPELSNLREWLALSAQPEAANNCYSGNIQPEITMRYNQEPIHTQLPNVLSNSYDNNPYQQQYTIPYPVSMFTPHQTQTVPQISFPLLPVTNPEPSNTTYVSLYPPRGLKYSDHYQQPTIDSHSSFPSPNQAPGPGSHQSNSSQFGLYQNPKITQNVAPSVRPMVPTQQVAGQPSPAPRAPPPTIQTVDTSNVPAHHKPIVATLTRLFKETSEALGGNGLGQANSAMKREIEDNSRKLGDLFFKLNKGNFSKKAAEKLARLCQALDRQDLGEALQIQVLMTNTEWDECSFWLVTLKRMIKGREQMKLSQNHS